MKNLNIKNIINISFEEAFKDFQKYNEAKGLSDRSIEYYDCCYKYFTQFYNEKEPCNKIDITTYMDYCIYLKEHTSANDVTRQTYVRGLRTILYFCMERDYMNPFKIHLPRAVKKAKEIYTPAELRTFTSKTQCEKMHLCRI